MWVDRVKVTNDRRTSRRDTPYFARRFDEMARAFGFADSYFLADEDGSRLAGMSLAELEAVCDEAELVIAISESPPPSSPLLRVPRRAYLDVDPGFTQIWAKEWDMGLDAFTHFFTIGQNVGRPGFTIPDARKWITTLPPVALDWWPVQEDEGFEDFTTVTDWYAVQGAKHDGLRYGGKRSEFLRVVDLPRRTGQVLTLAVALEGEYRDAVHFADHGWNLVDSYRFAGDVFSYREFIQSSRGEFSVAKHGYVQSNSGWISDRTAAYLSSGKPALIQSTGIESYLPVGKGLLTFRDVDEAQAGIAEINANYAEHSRAARAIAEEFFDSSVVLPRFLAAAGVTGIGR